MTWHSDSQND